MRKEADGEHAPEAARAVHREGVERVVDLELAHGARGEVVDKGGEEADEDGVVRGDDGAAGGVQFKGSGRPAGSSLYREPPEGFALHAA